MKDKTCYWIGTFLSMFMTFIGVYGMVYKNDVVHGVILFGLGLYMLNIFAISKLQKQIIKTEGGKE